MAAAAAAVDDVELGEKRGRASDDAKSRGEEEEEDKEKPPYIPHQGEFRQYLRDIILGANDGVVSLALLVFGVAGGGLTNQDIFLTGLMATIAGSISMALGEYLATKSQREVYASDLELERIHLKYYRDREKLELREYMASIGLDGRLLDRVCDEIATSDDAMLRVMARFEFGVNETDERSPYKAMLTSGGVFLIAALPTFLPFVFTDSQSLGLALSGALSGVALFGIGAAKTMSTRLNLWLSGLENLVIGLVGAAVSYSIGLLYDAS